MRRELQNRIRARVRDEGTSAERWAVYTETLHGNVAWMAVRFNRRAEALGVCRTLNAAFKREGRLWEGAA